MAALIEAEHLYRYYGKHRAVKDVSFKLEKGEVLAFLGPNGAGKTTTLQMLSGVLAPSSGHIRINGLDLLQQPVAAKRHLGYLPDTPPLYRELTVQEFLHYCASLRGIASNARQTAVAEAIERCSLQTVKHRLIGNLSKGFQQRIGIAQAILHHPEVILLDEPTAGLDPVQISEIRQLIRELGRQHGVMLSTHRLSEAQATCTHVQIIHQGQLLLQDSIDALQHRMTTHTVQITTRLPPNVAQLAALDGITGIDTVADNRLTIHYRADTDPIPRLTEMLIAGGWELQELTPVKQSLEDLFITLIRDNAP